MGRRTGIACGSDLSFLGPVGGIGCVYYLRFPQGFFNFLIYSLDADTRRFERLQLLLRTRDGIPVDSFTAETRVLLAGIALFAYAVALGRSLPRLADWRTHLVIGAFNSGIPFALFAFAALHIGASYMAVINASFCSAE